MKVKLQYIWNIQYYYEIGCPALKITIPTQVKAASFDEAKLKVEAFLTNLENGDKMRVNALTLQGAAVIE